MRQLVVREASSCCVRAYRAARAASLGELSLELWPGQERRFS